MTERIPYRDLEMFATSRVWMMNLGHLRAYVRLARGLKLGAGDLRFVAEEHRAAAARPAGGRVSAGDIAVLPLLGAMSFRGGLSSASTAEYGDSIAQAVADPNVRALVLEIDSPGGEVSGVEEVATRVRQARSQKPIVASVNTFAASAAYYIAAQASEVVATPSGEVGSIGTYVVHEDWSRALDQEGVTVEILSAGEGKVDGNPYEPLSEDARTDLQGMVDRYYGMFISAVAKGRSVPVERVRGDWKARLYGARDAVSMGLADKVGTLTEAIQRAGQLSQERRSAAAALDLDVETRMRARR